MFNIMENDCVSTLKSRNGAILTVVVLGTRLHVFAITEKTEKSLELDKLFESTVLAVLSGKGIKISSEELSSIIGEIRGNYATTSIMSICKDNCSNTVFLNVMETVVWGIYPREETVLVTETGVVSEVNSQGEVIPILKVMVV